VIASDVAGSLDYYAHDGTQYDLIGRFQVLVAAISAGDISSTIVLKNTDAGGSLNPGMTIDPDGAVQLSGVSIDGGFVDERDVSADGAALDLVVGGTFSVDVTTTGTFEPSGDTSAGDNSALGYTAAEGAILTGQGSTYDISLKNDADGLVFGVPTGTTDGYFPGNVGIGTSTPSEALHVKAASGNVAISIETTAGAWRINNNAGAASLNIGVSGGTTPVKIRTTAATNLLRIGQSSTTSVDLNGDLNLSGALVMSSGPRIIVGSGSPESVETAAIGSMFLRTDGSTGTSWYAKESGVGNTGWVAK